MTDPLARAEFERDISMLADPEIEMSARRDDDGFQICFVRRRGDRDQLRFQDPDRA